MEPDSWSVHRQRGRKGWYLHYRIGGCQKTRKIEDSEEMGKKEARKAARAFFQATPSSPNPQPKKPVNDLYGLLEGYLLMEKGLLAGGTLKFIKFCILRWFQEAGWRDWEDVSPLSVQKGYISVLKALKAGEMQAKYWASVRCYTVDFCEYAVRHGCLQENPVKALPAPKKSLFRKTQVIWSEDEFMAIHSLLEPFLAMQFWLMRYTGMDLADLAGVRRFHLTRDPEGGWVLKKPRKKEERFQDAWILFPLNSFVEDIFLEAYRKTREAEDLLFPGIHLGVDGEHSLLYARVRRRWGRVYPGKRFKNLKALRHTFASWCIQDLGIPLDVVQDWLGHTPGSTVLKERYLHRGSTARFARLLGAIAELSHGSQEQVVAR